MSEKDIKTKPKTTTKAIPETFLLSTHKAAGIMLLSQQTAALALRQDRGAIKKRGKTFFNINLM